MTRPTNLDHIRGVLFDLDGTLYKLPGHLKLRTAMSLLTSLRFLRRFSSTREWIREQEFSSKQEFDQAFYAELGRRAGRSAIEAQAWFEHRFIPGFVRLVSTCRPRPGTISMLTALKAGGIKTAVLSDFGWVEDRLRALGIMPELFDLLLSADEAGALKPSPLPFTLAANHLNLDPSQILVVGDRLDLDAQGAANVGMQFLGVTDGPPEGALQAWRDVVTVLKDLTG